MSCGPQIITRGQPPPFRNRNVPSPMWSNSSAFPASMPLKRGKLRGDLTAVIIGAYRCRGCGLETRTSGGMWKHFQGCGFRS